MKKEDLRATKPEALLGTVITSILGYESLLKKASLSDLKKAAIVASVIIADHTTRRKAIRREIKNREEVSTR